MTYSNIHSSIQTHSITYYLLLILQFLYCQPDCPPDDLMCLAFTDLATNLSSQMWTPKKIKALMDRLNETTGIILTSLHSTSISDLLCLSLDSHSIIMTCSAAELASIMSSIGLALHDSPYTLICLLSRLIPNVRSKESIQHNGTKTLHLWCSTSSEAENKIISLPSSPSSSTSTHHTSRSGSGS